MQSFQQNFGDENNGSLENPIEVFRKITSGNGDPFATATRKYHPDIQCIL
jgi:hypothetical protein